VPDARVEVVPSGVDMEHLRPRSGPAPGRQVVFCGVMDYPPNEQGAVWLARDVWPLVRQRFPDARLALVGSNPTGRVRRLAADPSVIVTGRVADVRPYLWRSAAAVAPLQLARGVQNKVLEAVAAALPVVVTPVVADGLPREILPACRTADGVEAFAREIGDLLARSPGERRAIAHEARTNVLSWQARLDALAGLLEAAARPRVSR
jgi:glycosyltransferase involved in cell wall biosynthesis